MIKYNHHIKNNNIFNNINNNPKKNIIDKISPILKDSNYKKNITSKFNDQLAIIDDSIPKWVFEQIAKYPKGTFKRVNKKMEIDGVMRKIVFEGVKIDIDITAEGFAVLKHKVN